MVIVIMVIVFTMNVIINIPMRGKENKLLPRIFLLSISETDPQLLHSVSHQLDQCAVQLSSYTLETCGLRNADDYSHQNHHQDQPPCKHIWL